MCTKLVLLLFVVLVCCYASPASFESSENKDVVHVRRQRTQLQNVMKETQDEAVAVVSRQAEPEASLLLQIITAITSILRNVGLAGTNCVPLDCVGNATAPIDAGRCLTCLALVAVAGLGK